MEEDYVQFYLAKARKYLNDYIDDIPNEVLHNIHSTHKVSSGWFQHCGNLFYLTRLKGITDEVYGRRFWEYMDTSGLRARLTTKEDIQFVDGLLKEFIAELESKKVSSTLRDDTKKSAMTLQDVVLATLMGVGVVRTSEDLVHYAAKTDRAIDIHVEVKEVWRDWFYHAWTNLEMSAGTKSITLKKVWESGHTGSKSGMHHVYRVYAEYCGYKYALEYARPWTGKGLDVTINSKSLDEAEAFMEGYEERKDKAFNIAFP